jgi:7,8-dihydroneopterin aldolase/epimerase/oxygenase
MSAERDVSSDRIQIEQLEIFGRVGVPEEERAVPQRLVISITLWPTADLGHLNDAITRTVNYSAVCDATKKFVGEQSPKLIETLADRLAAHLLATFPIRKITVELRKFVLPDAQYVSVTVTRNPSDD